MFGGFGDDLAIVDFNAIMSQLNSLHPGADASQIMVTQGIRALDQADSVAMQAAAGAGEQAKRDDTRAHLQYYVDHSDQLAAGFWDIKSWVIKAFVLYNASVEVSQQAIFLPSVLEALKEAPGVIGGILGQAAAGVAQGTAEGIFGALKGLVSTPTGIAVVVGAGYLAYRKWFRKAAA
jgi:hypothetical protein